MNRYFQNALVLLMITTTLHSCGNSESPESVVAKWCELSAMEHGAKTDQEKASARLAKEAYEKEVDEKYISNTKFYTAVMEGMKACEEKLKNIGENTPV